MGELTGAARELLGGNASSTPGKQAAMCCNVHGWPGGQVGASGVGWEEGVERIVGACGTSSTGWCVCAGGGKDEGGGAVGCKPDSPRIRQGAEGCKVGEKGVRSVRSHTSRPELSACTSSVGCPPPSPPRNAHAPAHPRPGARHTLRPALSACTSSVSCTSFERFISA
eukprot:353444-Chlamydomonas_euryale.AAC.3